MFEDLNSPDDPDYVEEISTDTSGKTRKSSSVQSIESSPYVKNCEVSEDDITEIKDVEKPFRDPPAKPETKPSKGFPCAICDHVASSSGRLKEHLSKHTGKKHLQCNICDKKFAWRYSYRSHMACHSSDNPNRCHICEKKYCNKATLNRHILKVHKYDNCDVKACDKCDKTFQTKSELERHLFAHTTERPCVCELCGKSYRYKAALVIHMKSHTDEKPFKCEFCDATFLYQSSAIGHRRTHTKEKPFKCSVCQKRCRTKRLLSSHMSVHSENKRFKCQSCGMSYSSRSGYRSHLDYHLGLKRHICKYCGKAFRARNNMDKHVRRHAKNRSCHKNRRPATKKSKVTETKIRKVSEDSDRFLEQDEDAISPVNSICHTSDFVDSQFKDCEVGNSEQQSFRNEFSQMCCNGPQQAYGKLPHLENRNDPAGLVRDLHSKQNFTEQIHNEQGMYWNLDYNTVPLERQPFAQNTFECVGQGIPPHYCIDSSQCQIPDNYAYHNYSENMLD